MNHVIYLLKQIKLKLHSTIYLRRSIVRQLALIKYLYERARHLLTDSPVFHSLTFFRIPHIVVYIRQVVSVVSLSNDAGLNRSRYMHWFLLLRLNEQWNILLHTHEDRIQRVRVSNNEFH